jgi:hypothetical protein
MWASGKANYGAIMFDVVLAINVVKTFSACKDDFAVDADPAKSTCASSIVGAIMMYDPTGISGVVKSLMKPKCDHS